MSQNDFSIANQTASSFRSDLNSALQALASLSSGGTAPSTTYANMLWYDTTNNLLKMRNESDSAWITIGTLNQSTSKFEVDNLPTLTEGTWEAGTNTTEATVSPAKVKAAIDSLGEKVTTATVNTAIASSSVGAVGTYAFLSNVSGTANDPGETEAAANLRYFGIRDTQVSNAGNTYGSAPSAGTWRCMGFAAFAGAGIGGAGGTLWLRIA